MSVCYHFYILMTFIFTTKFFFYYIQRLKITFKNCIYSWKNFFIEDNKIFLIGPSGGQNCNLSLHSHNSVYCSQHGIRGPEDLFFSSASPINLDSKEEWIAIDRCCERLKTLFYYKKVIELITVSFLLAHATSSALKI
jgi:hypothetical protein